MNLGQIADVASIVGTVIAVISLIISANVLVKVKKITIKDDSTDIHQTIKGDKNKQIARG